jgi:hypothetical protein
MGAVPSGRIEVDAATEADKLRDLLGQLRDRDIGAGAAIERIGGLGVDRACPSASTKGSALK